MKAKPLDDIRVLDFSTLLPGPLATLYLVQAGAEVIKIERPGGGDPIRNYPPFQKGKSILFELLNGGKCSVAVDLKNPTEHCHLLELVSSIDVVIEQFRPGVMERLKLDFDSLKKIKPDLIYCSISGYGQFGSRSQIVGHDLNYQAWSGLLALAGDYEGHRIVPALIADIAGGTHPAVINILLALRHRERTGNGCYLDIAMTDGLFPFMLSALANWVEGNDAPGAGADLLTGGSPRYQLYPTADRQHLAAAPLEEHFWQRFTELIELPKDLRSQEADTYIVCQTIKHIISEKSAAYWEALFDGEDTCCTVVRNLTDVLLDPDVQVRQRVVSGQTTAIDLLAIPRDPISASAPSIGQHNFRFGFLEPDH
uniref:Predicted acyl-CoA transferases/carnitine dehydratase n=1 Tax=uncultured gamma proteobacterium HF0200_24F15 TaxID=723570 RepID=E7C3Y6_9GAMM|nr:predicted acyl-CoA transferases/carnitine dehydratase [uncultured gamma proteobacterium HF0200_24F15]